MKDNNLSDLLNFAREIAWEAGQLTLGYFQSGVRPDWKDDQSPVTAADRDAESLIRGRIEAAFPRHAIVGEEHGLKESKSSSHRWIIDPIDGTKSFIRGVPLYGVLIGLEIEGRVEIGIAHFPALNEMVSAASGLGCYLNGRQASVSDKKLLSESFMMHIDHTSFEKHGRGGAFSRLSE
ncbi:MAG: inositol monophosphatase family protein, partial [Chloroflexota bacterium]